MINEVQQAPTLQQTWTTLKKFLDKLINDEPDFSDGYTACFTYLTVVNFLLQSSIFDFLFFV